MPDMSDLYASKSNEKHATLEPVLSSQSGSEQVQVTQIDGLQRRLGNRQIQLLAIGGSIGTALFISIGSALHRGGPGSLLISFILHCGMVALVNNCMAEMTTYMPVTGGFIRLAGHWVDDAFGFMAGWNFFVYEAITVAFEIAALNVLLGFWRDDIPAVAVCLVVIAVYIAINVAAVGIYGEAEFWLSGGKVVLIFMLFAFTFITMVGGNPRGDKYGFRYWKNPGPFAEHLSTGDVGRFEGLLSSLWTAIFTIVGPEYISMVAAEAKHPRVYLKKAFKTVYIRFGIFFIGGALAVGIVLPYNDPRLTEAIDSGVSSAAASPYVIAMQNLGISVLPDIASALMFTSVFSAGNTYTYASTRCLYSLALEGRAPAFLKYTTRSGVPVLCFACVAAISCLSLLTVSSSAYTVLGWLISLTTANIIINYIITSITYIFFFRACKAQNFDRSRLPYVGKFQPWCGYIALVYFSVILLAYGYGSFRPWSLESFFLSYTMLAFNLILFVFWKLYKKTRYVRPHEADLIWEAPVVAAYETIETTPINTFWREMLQLFTFNKFGGPKKQGLE
ncbi:Amino acid permease-like protein 26 [Elsinoe fawcettii]|nr:Amino acid permease-like protein 26 [Elsinoe fawcettii]